MGKLTIEQCPETGICSLVSENGTKVDLMPDEVADLKDAKSQEDMKKLISEIDNNFADSLGDSDLEQISKEVI